MEKSKKLTPEDRAREVAQRFYNLNSKLDRIIKSYED